MNDQKYFYLNDSDGLNMGVIGAKNYGELLEKIRLCFTENQGGETFDVIIESPISFYEPSEQDVCIKYIDEQDDYKQTLYLGLTALY